MTNFEDNPISQQNVDQSYSSMHLFHSVRLKLFIRAVAGGGLLILLALAWLVAISPQQATAQSGGIPLVPDWSSGEFGKTRSVAWGDWDNDGDLDLAVGNFGQPNRVYENVGGTLLNNPAGGLGWIAPQISNTTSVAWGDWDNDRDLDLAVGNDGQANQVYENDGGILKLDINFGWTASQVLNTQSVAWGDWNNDGYLDLAVGNSGQPNQVYQNNQNGNFSLVWEPDLIGIPIIQDTQSVAWGDWNDDGFLDLAVGNIGDTNAVYENQVGTDLSLAWPLPFIDPLEAADTTSVAWGDYDRDGDLDLAVGNRGIDWVYEYDETDGRLKLDPANDFGWEAPNVDDTYSVAWGDVDNDGDLDLAVGNANVAIGQASHVYCNDGDQLSTSPCWSSLLHSTFSLAWGDADGDGDLDLAVGNGNIQPNRLYRNNSPRLSTTSTTWVSFEPDNTQSVAWGDVDHDGDLDLAVGNRSPEPNRLYLNNDGVLSTTTTWEPLEPGNTYSVAWGDVDGDGDLDLAVGNNSQPNRLYRNNNGTLNTTAAWSSSIASGAHSVAWGDVDGDGDLDLAVGNFNDHNHLYLNEGGVLATSPGWESDEADFTTSVAWGDMDNDGDLDLAVGNDSQPNRLYLNHDGKLSITATWSSPLTDVTQSVAWGDADGDGDLDLAVGNSNFQPNRLYTNDEGTLKFDPAHGFGWQSDESDDTNSVAWGDADGDGDLDLAVGNEGRNRLYRNDGGGLTTSEAWSSDEADNTSSVAWGDVDGDGDLDLAVGNLFAPNQLYLTRTPRHPLQPGQVPTLRLNLYSDPAPTFNQLVTALAPANFYAIPGIRVGPTIPISYTISDPEASSTWRVRGFFSPDGGGRWFPASAATGTLTQNVASGVEQVYVWDVANSGFFGQSDNVVFRLEALPGGKLPVQFPYVTAHTYPFRVRGTQVRVVDEAGQPVQGALVYRLPGGQPLGGTDAPFRTSSLGYLSGGGQLNLGDQLVALWPVSQTSKYTLYHTNATPTPTGLDTFTVSQSGVQTLTVSAANPLVLFNLNVSLEWDATNDPLFQTELEQNLGRASTALYDWTNGQVALAQVTVYQDKERWDEADVHIFASNQVRPIANRGGIVTATTVLTHPTFTEPLTATQGEIRIGPNWNRYGDPQPIGQDWPRVLAHELGHYALFLEDTYLGLDQNNGLLIAINSCNGTAMSDPYVDSFSEFRYNDGEWAAQCGQTLAELPDWELIRLAYPALHSPTTLTDTNTGPTTMPLAFTQIELKAAPGQPQPLLDDFNITLGNSLSDGRAYLRHPGVGLVDLGRPVLNSILARGAREGDELCIFAAAFFACSSLSNSGPPQLTPRSAWQPEIILTPISSTTVQILVNNANASSVTATFYPNGEVPQQATLTPGVIQTVTLTSALEVLVEIRGDDPDERLITGYAAGAGPGRKKGHGGPGRKKGHGGPFATGDGSVLLYPPEDLPDDVFMVLQTATSLPELPAGLTPIGRAYHIRSSSAAETKFAEASLNFQYLGLDVLLSQKPEQSLAVYYWDGATWTRLETILNLTQNFASAPLPGSGLYVLTAGGVGPAITAVSPISGTSGPTHTLTITGQNFLSPLAITLKGQTDLSYSLTVASVNTQTVTALTPLTLPADLYDLELTNAGGLTATRDSAFALYTARPGACFFDDFASGWGKWTHTGVDWDIVTTGGQEAATDSPGASYLNADSGLTRTTTITSQSFSLAACPNPSLSFRHDYVIAIGPGQYQDWGTVEISTDDGATWRKLDSYSGGGGYDLTATADEWSNVNWQTVTLNLAQSSVPTNTTTARLRFNLVADAVGSDKGWIVDEVLVETCPSQGCAPSFGTKLYLPLIFK